MGCAYSVGQNKNEISRLLTFMTLCDTFRATDGPVVYAIRAGWAYNIVQVWPYNERDKLE
jgi:hypothetical protein